MTKDADFVNSFWLRHQPYKLLLVSTGNITNNNLILLFDVILPTLDEAFALHYFIEIDQHFVVVHG